jgi:hypothetical protein
MSGETSPNYKIAIQSANLKVRAVKVSPVQQLQHLNELKRGVNAVYRIRRTECKTYTIPSGNPLLHSTGLPNAVNAETIGVQPSKPRTVAETSRKCYFNICI